MLPAQAEDLDHHPLRSIQVEGNGHVSIPPDKADLTLSIEVQAKSSVCTSQDYLATSERAL